MPAEFLKRIKNWLINNNFTHWTSIRSLKKHIKTPLKKRPYTLEGTLGDALTPRE